ncbi:MAG TPA: lytic transglycosylase domain-containing protein, partial [Thermoanaerobaculia bacterium]
AAAERPFLALTVPPAPLSVRSEARERLIRIAAEAEQFDEGLEHARALVVASPGTVAGFEPLWKLGWASYRARDFAGARHRFEALAGLYRDSQRERRILYWRARCVDQEGRAAEATPLYESLAAASPADLYALFARRRIAGFRPRNEPALVDPSTVTAAFRRTEELLRLRLFEEAAAEARALPSSRGRDLRLAEAEFALGRFAPAASAVKRAFPEIGTAEEARVPDAWRRLYYPIEVGGFLGSHAAQFRLDPAILRGLVRQESVFDSGARSRAGALGLTQLMPATARGLAKSVLRVRYRRAFLYDPSVNSKLGAAYLKYLFDRFSGNPLWALAAYNGGPTRMARVLRENPGLPDDEVFESHPAYETRDYVRRVMLFAESYRELYPGTQADLRAGEGREERRP